MARTRSGTAEADASASALIEASIADLGDWRGETLARVRRLIRQADPDIVEEVKWKKPSNAMRGVPVWSHAGMICTGETYKDKIKLTFARARRSRIRPASSTRALTAAPGVPSTWPRARPATRRRSRH